MIFVDTSFWIALGARRDDRHEAAVQLWQRRPAALATTNYVLGEVWTFVNRRHGHTQACRIVRSIRDSPSVAIEHASLDVEDEAWGWLQRHSGRAYSFVDATSFAVMRRQRIREAYAFDDDFTAAGFVELRP